jgi:hypothetical protein
VDVNTNSLFCASINSGTKLEPRCEWQLAQTNRCVASGRKEESGAWAAGKRWRRVEKGRPIFAHIDLSWHELEPGYACGLA